MTMTMTMMLMMTVVVTATAMIVMVMVAMMVVRMAMLVVVMVMMMQAACHGTAMPKVFLLCEMATTMDTDTPNRVHESKSQDGRLDCSRKGLGPCEHGAVGEKRPSALRLPGQ